MTTRLQRLYTEQDQSPWLDNLKRGWITSGELERWVERGVRGITSNPTIFQKAMAAGDAYDAQLAELTEAGASTVDAYWAAVTKDISDALDLLAPVHEASDGLDGYVSLELAPELARETEASAEAARRLHETIARPNLYVKIPGTAEGLPAVQQMIAECHSINVTLIFGLDRYAEVIEAYLAGLEANTADDLSGVSSVASFFVSRLDTEVDRRLDAVGTDEAIALKGRAAVAQAQCAYQLFLDRFSGPRWDALAARGARVQRPLWASTSTKNPAYPDTLYVDELIGPRSVNTMPDATLEAYEDHGALERRVDADPEAAQATLDRLAGLGIDMADVTRVLEDEGVASFSKSFDELLGVLGDKAEQLRRG